MVAPEVREATPGDVEAIREVHREAILELGPEAYDETQVRAWASGVDSADYGAVTADEYYFVVAETGNDDPPVETGGVVAFGTLLLAEPEGYGAAVDAEVTGVYVHPSVAREGIGSVVLADLEARARDEGVDTLGLTASANAVPFYDARGYERVRTRRHEFSSHEETGVEGEVVEMRKRL